MSKLLIDSVKLVEKWKRATPVLERMVERGGWCYMAGTLCLSLYDPDSDRKITEIDIKPIDDTESDIIQYGMYLASRIFINSGKTGSCFYPQAEKNIEIYEKELA